MRLILLCVLVGLAVGNTLIPADSPSIGYMGRVAFGGGIAGFDWSGIKISTTVCNSTVMSLQISDYLGKYSVVVDGEHESIVHVMNYPDGPVELPTTGCHSVVITKLTEAFNNPSTIPSFKGLLVDGDYDHTQHPFTGSGLTRRIEFIGDSITCGYGILAENEFCQYPTPIYDYEDVNQAFPGLLAAKFESELHVECWSGKGLVHNSGDDKILSVEPMPAVWNRTFAVSPDPIDSFDTAPDAVYINLGTNDFGNYFVQPTKDQFVNAYHNFLSVIRSKYGQSTTFFLACGPMMSGDPCSYVEEVAQSEPNAHYINLQGLMTVYDYGCAYHPNVDGHQKMAEASSEVMSSVLGW